MAIITITRGQHSGGEEVAQAIADKLGARCVSVEVLREAALKYGVPEDKVEGAFEKSPTFWERMTESRRVYVAYVQAAWDRTCSGRLFRCCAPRLLMSAPAWST